MSLVEHARRELELAGWFDKDGPYDGMFGPAVIKMMEAFAAEGHSGMSAGIALQLFSTLAKFEPLTPLTGADDEWNDITDMNGSPMWQNNRCSRVFKNSENVWDIEGKVFEDKDGCTYTSKDSRVDVVFPYTPTTERVKDLK